MNLVDLLIAALAVLAIVSGFRRGAALQILTYVGLLAGLFAGALLAPPVAGLVDTPLAQAVAALVVLVALTGAGDALGWWVGARAWTAARRSRLSPVDAAAGSVVSVVALLLATWLLAFNLVQGPFPFLARQIRGSAIVRGLDEILPAPPSILTEARRFLDRFGFPEVFTNLPPAPAGPVALPSDAEARRAAAGAVGSTVRIVGEACGLIQEGSGFVAADGYIVTNAHVVAGVPAPQVQQQNGGSEGATTVLFDPDLDVAVLRVGTSPGPALTLRRDVVDRGARGAVLGYPGGGPLDVERAAVRRSLEAVGRDIYGRRTVVREVYEVQAAVRPGSSGGPFVLGDGTVAGVVFAASTTEGNVGYALTSTSVGPDVRSALGRTAPVDTRPCIR
ncbi:MAG TPA: MarP family serine protease [Actinomycetota bacterium]|nr:MarP family serine protease [Actinomycetota bacterium]